MKPSLIRQILVAWAQWQQAGAKFLTGLRFWPDLLRISIRNQSSKPLVFIDDEHHCGFTLVENEFMSTNGVAFKTLPTPARHCTGGNWQEHLLQPGQAYAFEIDMTDPLWHVSSDKQTVAIGELQNRWNGFRWLYRLPNSVVELYANRPDVWQSGLRTTRFTASGRID